MNTKLVTGFIVITYFSISQPALADESVSGYTRKDGTQVQSYQRSNPNSTTSDNYSTKGNTNPYTGKAGTKNNDNN